MRNKILAFAALCSIFGGCAILQDVKEHEVWDRGQKQLVGMQMERLLSCAGQPFEISEQGDRSEMSYGYGMRMSFASSWCVLNLEAKNGIIENYKVKSGNPGGLTNGSSTCAYIVDPCVSDGNLADGLPSGFTLFRIENTSEIAQIEHSGKTAFNVGIASAAQMADQLANQSFSRDSFINDNSLLPPMSSSEAVSPIPSVDEINVAQGTEYRQSKSASTPPPQSYSRAQDEEEEFSPGNSDISTEQMLEFQQKLWGMNRQNQEVIRRTAPDYGVYSNMPDRAAASPTTSSQKRTHAPITHCVQVAEAEHGSRGMRNYCNEPLEVFWCDTPGCTESNSTWTIGANKWMSPGGSAKNVWACVKGLYYNNRTRQCEG